MHSAVTPRTVEIATLRAIGFASSAVAISILIEALVLALLGAVVGVAIAYAAFKRHGDQHARWSAMGFAASLFVDNNPVRHCVRGRVGVYAWTAWLHPSGSARRTIEHRRCPA